VELLVLACGFLVADISVSGLDKLAEPGELVYVKDGISLHVGGHPANLSINLVKLGISGSEICVVGNVGNDVFGHFIENSLSSAGIRSQLRRSSAGTTKDVIILVRGQDRRYHVDLGASWETDPEDVKTAIKEHQPLVFYIASGMVGKVDDTLGEILKLAKSEGSFTFLDVVTPYGKGWDFVIPALRWADAFHCNDQEILQITRRNDVEAASEEVMNYGAKILLLTMGNRGAVARTRQFELAQPAFEVEVVDPTGAGDAFCAGVVASLMTQYREALRELDPSTLNQRAVSEALLLGQAVSAVKCTGIGTTSAVSRDKVLRLLKDQGEKVRSSQLVRTLS
jgi:sugar/nucleoside kinase (ribokinase family)